MQYLLIFVKVYFEGIYQIPITRNATWFSTHNNFNRIKILKYKSVSLLSVWRDKPILLLVIEFSTHICVCHLLDLKIKQRELIKDTRNNVLKYLRKYLSQTRALPPQLYMNPVCASFMLTEFLHFEGFGAEISISS